MTNILELATHITALCAEHGITMEERVSSGGRAYKRDRRIHIRPVKSLITYFVALHEIGHIVHPQGSGKGLRLEKEYHAWDWAIDNALVDPSDVVMARIRTYLKSYLAKANRSTRMKLPAQDHPLWDFMKE